MKKYNIIFFFIWLVYSSFSLYGQSLSGKNIHELKEPYESYYIFPNSKSSLKRAVIKSKDESGYNKYTYCYTDQSGIIKIELMEPYIFADKEYLSYSWDIDTNFKSSVSDFSEGLAAIRNKETDLCGFINSNGHIVIDAQYNYVGNFNEGLAYFAKLNECFGENAKQNEVGYIEKSNKPIILLPEKLSLLYSCCYFMGGQFKNGVAIMKLVENNADCNCSPTIVIDKKGKVLNIYGNLYDKDGQLVTFD